MTLTHLPDSTPVEGEHVVDAIIRDGSFKGLRLSTHDRDYEFRLTKGWRWHPLISRENLAAKIGESIDYLRGLEKATRLTHQLQRRLTRMDREELRQRVGEYAEIRAVGRYEAIERWAASVEPDTSCPDALKHVPAKRFDRYMQPCAVYFLVRAGEVVYVGQTIRWPGRIDDHLRDGDKDFDDVWYIPVERAEMSRVEMHWIRKLKPEYNRHGLTGDV